MNESEMNSNESDGDDCSKKKDSPTVINSTVQRLTPELIMRAEFEVNEKEAWRMRDIEALREIVQNEPVLKSRLDDAFLLRFLRARRFDYDRAFQLICDYYRLRMTNSELFVPVEQLKPLFDDNLVMVLDQKSNQGETILLIRFGKWNTRKYGFDPIIAACMMSMEYIIRDEVTQINGIICLIDLAGFGWSQIRKFGPTQAKKCIYILEKCLPIRVKKIYVINESTLTDIGFAIIRPFMGEELYEKITFLGSNLTALNQFIMAQVLSNEFGGKSGPIDSSSWYKKLCSFEAEMKLNFGEFGYINSDLVSDFNSKCTATAAICRRGNSSESPFNGPDMKTLFRKSQTCNGYLFDYYNTSTSVD